MVVGQRREFYKNLAYNTYARLFDSNPWKTVKITDNASNVSSKFDHAGCPGRKTGNTAFFPFFMERIGSARFLFIGTGSIENPHENITVNHSLHGFGDQSRRQGKSGIGFHAVGIDRNNRNLRHSCFFQRPSDKSDVIGGAATTSGLSHKYSCFIQIIFS